MVQLTTYIFQPYTYIYFNPILRFIPNLTISYLKREEFLKLIYNAEYHIIHSFNMYNLMVFNTLIMCNHHRFVIPQYFQYFKSKPFPIHSSHFLHSYTWSLETSSLLFLCECPYSRHFKQMESYNIWAFCLLLSLSMIFSRFIHVVPYINASFT